MTKKMTDTELLAILDSEINDSIGIADGEDKQANALDYYYGRPFGTEVDGQSQVVTRDVFETIEWMLPSLLKPFISGNKTVVFDPTGQEDEEAAEQETDVINHCVLNENDGYLFYYSWFKDALLLDNSYAKVSVEEIEKTETQTYTDLSDDEFAEVVAQDNVEPIEHTQREEIMLAPTHQGVIQQQVNVHDIKIRVVTKEKKFIIETIPREEIRVSRKARSISLDKSPFVAHRRILTASDLIEMGFSKKIVDDLPAYEGGMNQIAVARDNGEDYTSGSELDKSMREIEVFECYIKVDYDRDGRAELRKILKSGNEILENEEFDFVPFEALTPIIMPHKHKGIGEANIVMDLQLIRSTLMRQMLTNLYLTNNPEKEVVASNIVNMAELLESGPGNIKRVTALNSIREIAVPFTAGASIPFLEILDEMQEKRTGVSRNTQGMDHDVLAQSTKGAFMGALEQANQRIEMVARNFAETGVKGIFKKLHELMIKHQDKERIIKLRNKWVPINPTEWKHRENMSVVVGIGTGNKDQLLSRLFTLAEKQQELLALGLPIVNPQNLYNTYNRIVENADLKNVEMYFTDPRTIPPQPPQQPPPNPLAEVEQIKGQFKLQSDQMQMQHKMALHEVEMRHKYEMEILKSRIDAADRVADRASREAIEAAKLEVQAFLQSKRIDIGQAGIGAGLNERPAN